MPDDVWEEQSYYPQTDPRTLFGDERLAEIAELVGEHLTYLEPDQSWDTMDTVTLIAAHMIDKGMLRGPKLPPLPEDSQSEDELVSKMLAGVDDIARRSGSGTP